MDGKKLIKNLINIPEDEIEKLSPKERVEIAKAQSEILDRLKPVWQKSVFYTSLATIVVTISSLWFAVSSGWFDTQEKLNEANEKLQEVKNESFKKNFLIEKKILTSKIDSLDEVLIHTNGQYDSLLREYSELKRSTHENKSERKIVQKSAIEVGSMTVITLDTKSNPLQKVEVYTQKLNEQGYESLGLTNFRGEFRCSLEYDTYKFKFSKRGYVSATVQKTLASESDSLIVDMYQE